MTDFVPTRRRVLHGIGAGTALVGITGEAAAASGSLSVTTDWADRLGDTEMILGGTLTDLGGADSADVWFQYRQAGTDSWTASGSQTLTTTGEFTETISNLETNTKYEYRAAAAASSNETATGSIKTFTTPEDQPEVTTDPPTGVDDTVATLNGTLTDLGGAESADVQFIYWRADGSNRTSTDPQTRTTTGDFREQVTGLDPNTTYEYQAFVAASDDDQDDGSIRSFTTDTGPTLQTDSPTNVDESAVTFNGEVNDLGGADSIDVWFVYFESGATAGQTTPRQTLTAPDTVSARVTELTPNTEYGVELRGEASDGDSAGGGVTYVTTDTRLAITTTEATNVEPTSATLNATVDDLGDATSVTVTFEHRPVGTTTWTTSGTRTTSATGTVSVSVDGLADDTDYEYRTTATASDDDTAAGGTSTFTTPLANEAPTVEQLTATDTWNAKPHVQLEVEWEVADVDGNLREVVVTIHNAAGDRIYRNTTAVTGSHASGTDRTRRRKHAANQDYTVTLDVQDTEGATTTATRTVST